MLQYFEYYAMLIRQRIFIWKRYSFTKNYLSMIYLCVDQVKSNERAKITIEKRFSRCQENASTVSHLGSDEGCTTEPVTDYRVVKGWAGEKK